MRLIIASVYFALFELFFWKGGFEIWNSLTAENIAFVIIGIFFFYGFLLNLKKELKEK